MDGYAEDNATSLKFKEFYRPLKSHYWHQLENNPTTTVKCGKELQLVDILVLPLINLLHLRRTFSDRDMILLFLYSNGFLEIMDSDIDGEKKWQYQIQIDIDNQIKFATIDTSSGRIFYTVENDRMGIFTVDLSIMKLNQAVKPVVFVRGSGNRRFEGLAVDNRGETLFCCDSKKHKAVRQWSLVNGGELPEVNMKGSPMTFAPLTIDITRGENDRFRYMAIGDWLNSRVMIFKIVGETIKLSHILADYGKHIAQVNAPRNLKFDPAGNLFVADTGNRRFQV